MSNRDSSNRGERCGNQLVDPTMLHPRTICFIGSSFHSMFHGPYRSPASHLAVSHLVSRLTVSRFAVSCLAVLRLAVLRLAVSHLAVSRLAVLCLAVLRLAISHRGPSCVSQSRISRSRISRSRVSRSWVSQVLFKKKKKKRLSISQRHRLKKLHNSGVFQIKSFYTAVLSYN